jgi:DNA-binding CsgD family transcriptional regulator
VREGIETLSEREKETLRLLLAGHDAKSIARHFGLSVHTINERLRDARRKLGVSGSREAARLLAEAERGGANSFADKQIGVSGASTGRNAVAGAGTRLAWLGGGMLAMSMIVAAVALTAAFRGGVSPAARAIPKVIATVPKEGAAIEPGPFVLSVTYDRPMQAGSYSFAGPRELAPEGCGTPELSADGRTYSMRCSASPGRNYEMWFNREPYMNFRSAEGVRAEPYRLTFRTNVPENR